MATKRSYGDPCGIARALDLVGQRWALLVVRELMLGPKRFTDLRPGLPHLSPDVLAQRLRELEAGGIVQRRTLPPPAGSRVYELTDWGRELEPVLLALGRWGSRVALPAGHGQLGIDAFVLALETLFDPSASDGINAGYELHLGEYHFNARVSGRRLELARGDADSPDATIAGEQGALSAVLWHGRSLEETLRSGAIALGGDRATAERFLALFPAPEPAVAAPAATLPGSPASR